MSVPVTIGAFWAGWLGWNTFTRQNNPLFPGDVHALELWDIAFESETSFLVVVIVACIAAIFVWRKSVTGLGKIALDRRRRPRRVVRLQHRPIRPHQLTPPRSHEVSAP